MELGHFVWNVILEDPFADLPLSITGYSSPAPQGPNGLGAFSSD
jgi:hypothetical protein